MRKILILVAILLLVAVSALAEVPKVINYQAKLTDADGVALNGDYDITFSIWDDATGGTRVWGPETHSSVTVTNGLFDVQLGTITTLGIDFSDSLWVEVEVEGVTLGPREKLGTVPYAFRAIYADNAGEENQTITTGAGITGAEGGTSGDFTMDLDLTSNGGLIFSGSGDIRTIGVDFGTGTNQVARGDHTHSAADITSGTLSTDRYSAYSDLVAEGKIASGSIIVTSSNYTSYYNDPDVNRIRSNANPWLQGDVTLQQGTNVTLNQSGNTITINATAGGVGGSGTATQVAFWDETNSITGTNDLYWDNTDKELEIYNGTNEITLDPGNGSIHFAHGAAPNEGDLIMSGSSDALWISGADFGIGTADPSYKLEVAGDAGFDAHLYHNDDDNTYIYFTPDRIQFYTGGRSMIDVQYSDNEVAINEGSTQTDFRVEGGTDTHLLFTDGSADRVGIGTASPSYKLDVNGDLRVDSPSFPGRDYRISCGGRQEIYANNDLVEHVSGNKAVIVGTSLGTNRDFYICGGAEGTKIFTVEGDDQQVGIGTTSPTTQLHTTGGVRFQGVGSTSSNTQILTRDSNGNLAYRDAGSWAGGTDNVTGTGISNRVAYWTGAHTLSYDNLYWDSLNDRLGIGTSPGSYKLDVNGNIHIPAGNFVSFLNNGWAIGKDHNADVGHTEDIQIEGWGGIWGSSTIRSFQVISQTGTSPYENHVVLQANLNNGNVGIGTTNPLSKLSVGGDGNASYAIYGTGSTYGVYGNGTSYGVYGRGSTYGGYFDGGTGTGVYGTASGTGNPGGYFVNTGDYHSLVGANDNSTYCATMGYNASGDGVLGIGSAAGTYLHSGSGDGVVGVSDAGYGVIGSYYDGVDNNRYGILGSSNNGVFGYSNNTSGAGVLGNGGSVTTGVYGTTSASDGYGIWGIGTASDGNGVLGTGSNCTSILYSGNGDGLIGVSDAGYGVIGSYYDGSDNNRYGYLGGSSYGVYGHNDAGDAIRGEATRTSTDDYGVWGTCNVTEYYGYGGYFEGGYKGLSARVTPNPTGSGTYYGLSAYSSSGTGGTGTNIAVYGYASGGAICRGGRFRGSGASAYIAYQESSGDTTGGYFDGGTSYAYVASDEGTDDTYGGYFDGNTGTNDYCYVGLRYSGIDYSTNGAGPKSTMMDTRAGRRNLFCPESPEVWFEDLGSAKLVNGHCHIELDPLFFDCVKIDQDHPMKVFIQLNDDCNGVYVKKGTTGFDVYELNGGTSDAAFDYRIVAKRRGESYEDVRFPPAPPRQKKKTDYLDLTKNIWEIPQEYRLEWVKQVPPTERDPEWLKALTPEQIQMLGKPHNIPSKQKTKSVKATQKNETIQPSGKEK